MMLAVITLAILLAWLLILMVKVAIEKIAKKDDDDLADFRYCKPDLLVSEEVFIPENVASKPAAQDTLKSELMRNFKRNEGGYGVKVYKKSSESSDSQNSDLYAGLSSSDDIQRNDARKSVEDILSSLPFDNEQNGYHAFGKVANCIPGRLHALITVRRNGHHPRRGYYFGRLFDSMTLWENNIVPSDIKCFLFCFGGIGHRIVESFVESEFPKTVEIMAIGCSEDLIGTNFDYQKIIKASCRTEYPSLIELILGDFDTSYCSSRLLGVIGDVTELIEKCPNIEVLHLYGRFELTKQIEFLLLKTLYVEVEDVATGDYGPTPSQKTITNLLESSFPSLEELEIHLEHSSGNDNYAISDDFLSGEKFPKLSRIHFSGNLHPEDIQKIERSALLTSPRIIHSSIENPWV